MASKEEIIAKTNAAREARKHLRDREAAAIQIQVNNFHKSLFCLLSKNMKDYIFYRIHEIKDVGSIFKLLTKISLDKSFNSSYL